MCFQTQCLEGDRGSRRFTFLHQQTWSLSTKTSCLASVHPFVFLPRPIISLLLPSALSPPFSFSLSLSFPLSPFCLLCLSLAFDWQHMCWGTWEDRGAEILTPAALELYWGGGRERVELRGTHIWKERHKRSERHKERRRLTEREKQSLGRERDRERGHRVWDLSIARFSGHHIPGGLRRVDVQKMALWSLMLWFPLAAVLCQVGRVLI